MINPIATHQDKLNNWLIDSAGNIAISASGVALLGRINALMVPVFTSSEQAIEWGSHLSDEQHATLADIQRTASNSAVSEPNLQRMVNLATQSQLMREAAGVVSKDSRFQERVESLRGLRSGADCNKRAAFGNIRRAVHQARAESSP